MTTEPKSINITNDDVQSVLNTEAGKYQLQIAALSRTLGEQQKEIEELKENSCSCNESEDKDA
jgi:hypothetical protein